MIPAILLLAAAAASAAPARPAGPAAPAARYEAGGFEPFWSLVIENGWLTFTPNMGDRPTIRVRTPRRLPLSNGYRYIVSPQLTVTVRHERCEGYNSRIYTDTVYVTGIAEGGCGGAPIAPPDLAYSGWTVRAVDRTRLPEGRNIPDVGVEFREGRMTLRGVCHSYAGNYRERRPLLQVTAIADSWTGCQASAIERRIVAIMRTPMRMRFVDGDTLVLSNRTGTLRLAP